MGATVLALFGTVVASSTQGSFDPKSEYLFVADKAIALLPPVVVARGKSRIPTWSRSGKWLFLDSEEIKVNTNALAEYFSKGATGRHPSVSESALTMFDVEKNTSQELARFKSDGSQLLQVQWLPGDRNLLFLMSEPLIRDDGTKSSAYSLYSAGTTGNKVNRLVRFREYQFAMLASVPQAKGAVLMVQETRPNSSVSEAGGRPPEPNWSATWIDVNGGLGKQINIPGNMRHPYWTASGEGPYFDNPVRDPETKKVVAQTFLLNFSAGTISEVPTPKVAKFEAPKLGFQTQYGQSLNAFEAAQASRTSLWLKSEEKSDQQYALVAAEAEQASLSPIGNAVFYASKGVAMVRPLLTMPKQMAIRALEAAEQAKVMNDAKQAALALIMYAADHDDTFPSNAGDWAQEVEPYLRNRDISNGFIYTYSGGPVSDIKNPAETELGYKAGPGGRAVAYADGHVKWVPDK